jgi:hypothetical protein
MDDMEEGHVSAVRDEEGGNEPHGSEAEKLSPQSAQAASAVDFLLATISQEVCEEIVTEVVFEEAESRAVRILLRVLKGCNTSYRESPQNSVCKAVFDSSVLPFMLRWLNEAALRWMAFTLRRPLASLEPWKARLESHLYQIIATLRYPRVVFVLNATVYRHSPTRSVTGQVSCLTS